MKKIVAKNLWGCVESSGSKTWSKEVEELVALAVPVSMAVQTLLKPAMFASFFVALPFSERKYSVLGFNCENRTTMSWLI